MCRRDDNIVMDLQDLECEGMDWIVVAQDRGNLRGYCECGNEPSSSIKWGEFLDWLKTG
jgi:hypothetical protein